MHFVCFRIFFAKFLFYLFREIKNAKISGKQNTKFLRIFYQTLIKVKGEKLFIIISIYIRHVTPIIKCEKDFAGVKINARIDAGEASNRIEGQVY